MGEACGSQALAGSRLELTSRCGADHLLERLGRNEKPLDMEVSFSKLALSWVHILSSLRVAKISWIKKS